MRLAIATIVLFGLPPALAMAANPEQLERGQYLVTTMSCHDCHTPKKMGPSGIEPDFSRALIGHPEGTVLPPPAK